jgi:hypothetical protein
LTSPSNKILQSFSQHLLKIFGHITNHSYLIVAQIVHKSHLGLHPHWSTSKCSSLCCVVFDEFETTKHPLLWPYQMPYVKHNLKNIKILSENNIKVIQIFTTMFNSQPTLGLQVHKNKGGKYTNSCKLLHLHTPIDTIFYKLCIFCMFYTRDLYVPSFCQISIPWLKMLEGDLRRELWTQAGFKCAFIFSFNT